MKGMKSNSWIMFSQNNYTWEKPIINVPELFIQNTSPNRRCTIVAQYLIQMTADLTLRCKQQYRSRDCI